MKQLEKNSQKEFNSWSEWYDINPAYWIFYFSNKKVLELISPKNKSLFLDVGCGTGILLKQISLLNRDIKLYGIDISKGMVEKAKQKLKNYKNITVVIGSGKKLPYGDNSFDYVTCCTSLHHHPDTLASLKEMYRVVKPGGKVLILDIAYDGILRKLNYWIDNIIMREGKTYAYTKMQIKKLFQECGFSQISQQNYWYFKLITIGIKNKKSHWILWKSTSLMQ